MAENQMVRLAPCAILVLPLRFGTSNELKISVMVTS
jgi:hypothetical protein